LIFTGDIAAPSVTVAKQLEGILTRHQSIFDQKRIICNFEGLVSDRIISNTNHPVLFNHTMVPDVLHRGKEPVLCLANNHILDLPEEYDSSVGTFRGSNALFCGAGKSATEASAHLTFLENGRKTVLINACWNFLLYNQRNPSNGVFVAEIGEAGLVDEVITIRQSDADTSIIIFLHWSFDLEILPFPMYRKLSRALIDAGADLVIGSHSHCVQGGEKYKDRYIIYGLGNFFMPHNIFAGGKINYPDFTRTELAFEWDPDQNIAVCHWFEYQNSGSGHNLLYLSSEKFEDSVILKQYSPFQGMTDKEYYNYFKANRRKRFLIPIYKDYNSKIQNVLYTIYLKNRARFANMLARLNLINWQN
jgi:hypothetical protein